MIDIKKLASKGFLRKFKQDEVVFREREQGYEMYIILKGKVEVSTGKGEGELVLAVLSEGDIFGEMSLLERMPRTATVRALEDSLVIALNQDNFENVIITEPALSSRIMRNLSNRIRKLDDEIRLMKKPDEAANIQLCQDNNINLDRQTVNISSSVKEKGKGKGKGKGKTAQSAYFYKKSITCPACGTDFVASEVKTTKLKLISQDPDLRQHYEGFEPLLYGVWICPRCYYASFRNDFTNLSEKQKGAIKEREQERKEKFAEPFGDPGNVDYAFKSHFLMLLNLDQCDGALETKAKVWLRLGWLYSDEKDQEKSIDAFRKALEMYKQAYFTTTKKMTAEQEQQMAYLIGELHNKLGDYKEAMQFYRRAVVHPGGNSVINKQAQDRVYKIRNMAKKSDQTG